MGWELCHESSPITQASAQTLPQHSRCSPVSRGEALHGKKWGRAGGWRMQLQQTPVCSSKLALCLGFDSKVLGLQSMNQLLGALVNAATRLWCIHCAHPALVHPSHTCLWSVTHLPGRNRIAAWVSWGHLGQTGVPLTALPGDTCCHAGQGTRRAPCAGSALSLLARQKSGRQGQLTAAVLAALGDQTAHYFFTGVFQSLPV